MATKSCLGIQVSCLTALESVREQELRIDNHAPESSEPATSYAEQKNSFYGISQEHWNGTCKLRSIAELYLARGKIELEINKQEQMPLSL